jgi:hypothetical protein
MTDKQPEALRIPITDDNGQAILPQYRVIERYFDWYLLYDQMQVGEAVRHEFRIVQMSHNIALFPGITLAEATKQFYEVVENDYR